METMIKKRLLIIIVLLTVLFIPSSFAIVTDFIAGYNLSSVNGYNATYSPLINSNSVTFHSGLVGTSSYANFTTTSQYLAYPSDLGITNGAMGVSMWIKPSPQAITSGPNNFSPSASTPTFFLISDDGTDVGYYLIRYNVSGNHGITFVRQKQNSANEGCGIAGKFDNNLLHLVATYDTTRIRLYLNGTLVCSLSASGNGVSGLTDGFNLSGGQGVQKYLGLTGSVYVFNHNLTASDVATLYNTVTPDYPFSVVGNFTITTYDYYTNSQINNFYATTYTNTFYSSGGNNPTNASDNNYETYASSSSGAHYYYWNYTLISNTTNLIWQVKDYADSTPTTVNLTNITQQCKNQIPLRLRAKSENAGGITYTAEWSCYNGSTFIPIRTITDSVGINRIYEQTLFENNNIILSGIQTNYTTTNGSITTSILNADASLNHIIVKSNQSQGYFETRYFNYNVTNNLIAYLNKTFLYQSISNNITYNGTIYARNLNYNLTLQNCVNDSVLMRYINGINDLNQSFVCNVGSNTLLNNTYTHSNESTYTLFFTIPSLYNYTLFNGNTYANTSNFTIRSDLNAPTIRINYTLNQGFSTTPNVSLSITCNDTLNAYNLTYRLLLNSNLIFNASRVANTTQSNTTSISQDDNTIYGYCSDFFSTTTDTLSFTSYVRTLLLYDELFYIPFDINGTGGNIGARAWFGDNSSVYDFKANNRNNVSFVTNNSKIRVQINYSTTDEVVRYLDLDLITDTTVRVCTNRNPTTHYEQIALSASEKAIIIKNVYAQCYVAGDYTRFAYQEAFSLKYFTVNSLYYAYTWSDGVQTLLASVDGSIQSFFNIDTIEFNRDSADLELTNDYVSIQKTGNSQINIYYKNPLGNNDDITASIYYAINNSLAFATSSFTNMSEWFLLFDYSTLPNATNTTQWKLVIVAERNNKTYTTTKYFDGTGSLGFLNSKLAFTLAVLFLIFGFTMTATNYTFGWFGVVIGLATMFILALAVSTWYILMLQALSAVLILYCIILLTMKNYVTVA